MWGRETIFQILFIASLSFLLGYIFAKSTLKEDLRKEKTRISTYIFSLLGLTISHLHDAANFFGLVKSSIHEKDLENSYNFSKGAAFHFRSLFEELKNNIENLDRENLNEDFFSSVNLLHLKESINLKDLLELELFQISNFNRIKFIDSTNLEHALIQGNFNLLSKALINLIENALKYTDGEIRIELKESNNNWQIRVSSFGKEITYEIIKQIENSSYSNIVGHGLSSLKNIIDYHRGKIEITTFAGEGSTINLYLPKINSINYSSKIKYKSPKKNKSFSKIFLIIIGLIAITSFSALLKPRQLAEQSHKNKFEKNTKELKTINKITKTNQKTLITTLPKAQNDSKLESLINKQDQDLGLNFEF